MCGKLVRHYPVCGCLRVASSFVKRACTGYSWDDDAGEYAKYLIVEIANEAIRDDPVRGLWYVNISESVQRFTDASNMALAAC